MIQKQILLYIFLIIFINFSLFLIPTISPNINTGLILPYQMWFNGLALFLVLFPKKLI